LLLSDLGGDGVELVVEIVQAEELVVGVEQALLEDHFGGEADRDRSDELGLVLDDEVLHGGDGLLHDVYSFLEVYEVIITHVFLARIKKRKASVDVSPFLLEIHT